MNNRNPSQPDNAQHAGGGAVAAGTEGAKPSPVAGDSPTEGTVEGPLAPQPSPAEAAESESNTDDREAGESDDLDELKKMEDNAEAGRE
jgi:hypothetical protein